MAGPLGALRHPRDLRADQGSTRRRCSSSTRAARPSCCSRNSGASTRTRCRSRCITARSTSASAGASRRRWRPTACAPSSPPRRSTSASTGATSTSSSMSARRRAPAGWRSASAAPTTAWTSRPRRSSCRPTASRCWNAAPRSKPSIVGAQDTPPLVRARSTCWRSMCWASPAPRRSTPTSSIDEVRTAAPYAELDRETFDRVVDFVATGGYALTTYERYARIRKTKDGLWRVSHPRVAQQYRLNVGTIIEVPALNVRYVRAGRGRGIGAAGRCSARSRRRFCETLVHGDTFLFAGKVLRFEGIRENECYVSNAPGKDAKVPYYGGGKFPLSTYLADQVRGMLADPKRWKALPDQVADWLRAAGEGLGAARARRPAGRDLSARRPLLHGRLSVRGAAGAPDARHAADAPAGARGRPAARLRRHRLCRLASGRSATWAQMFKSRQALARRAVRRGHAGRRSRCLAGRQLDAEAHVPQLRA